MNNIVVELADKLFGVGQIVPDRQKMGKLVDYYQGKFREIYKTRWCLSDDTDVDLGVDFCERVIECCCKSVRSPLNRAKHNLLRNEIAFCNLR